VLDLRNADGTSLGHTFGGHELVHAAHVALAEFGAGGTVAMLPASTHNPSEFMLLAVMADGRIFDSTMRLVGEAG
jgi:hypothetical protein